MNAQTLGLALADWLKARRWQHTHLTHNADPRVDPHAAYTVTYEAVFEPESGSAARVEVWLTATEEIAVGIDSCERAARRLAVRHQRSGFAGGHEPLAVSIGGLLTLLELVAAGNVRIRTSVIPVIGLVATKAVVSSESLSTLREKQYPTEHWLDVVDASKFSSEDQLVSFDHWR